MPAPTQGRARLERALISAHRAGRARRPEGRRHVVPATSGAPDPSGIPASEAGAEWSAAAGSALPTDPGPEPDAPVPEPAEPPQARTAAVPDANGLAEIVERLKKIEERLATLQEHARPAAATPGLFAEWVRMRHWQEIPFAEFLKLRRAGRI